MASNAIIERIEANPNPRSARGLVRAMMAWGKRNVRQIVNLNREAALDTTRNVLAVLGAGTVLGDFSTMRWWMLVPGVCILSVIWFIDYARHF